MKEETLWNAFVIGYFKVIYKTWFKLFRVYHLFYKIKKNGFILKWDCSRVVFSEVLDPALNGSQSIWSFGNALCLP